MEAVAARASPGLRLEPGRAPAIPRLRMAAWRPSSAKRAMAAAALDLPMPVVRRVKRGGGGGGRQDSEARDSGAPRALRRARASAGAATARRVGLAGRAGTLG